MLDIFSKIPNVIINCLGQNTEKFKILQFRIPNKDYLIKNYRFSSIFASNLDDLSKDLDDDLKL